VLPQVSPDVIDGYARVVESGEILHKEDFVPDVGRYFRITAFRAKPGQFVSTFHDITDRVEASKNLEQERAMLAQHVEERTLELRKANTELAQAIRHKDEFLASMSHELRTPLNAILGITEVMAEEIYGPLNEKQHKRLRDLEESGRHLLDLINDVLDVAKIDAGKLTLEIADNEINAICESSLRMIRQAALKKQLRIDVHIDTVSTHIQADGRRLKQMLMNLLSNAVKFTPEAGAIGLLVTEDAPSQAIHFTVWDTGIGIAPEEQRRLFQPFVQVDSSLSRAHEGTGLGLALVHKMAKLHGGMVSLESEPGKGSRFTLTLPRHNSTDPHAAN
jgi:signal transduction histidine kinase